MPRLSRFARSFASIPLVWFFAATLSAVFLISLPSTAVHAQGQVKIVVSVDWEGRNLDPTNLAAMEAFRKDYPTIPLQMFLNAAYFTKKDAKGKDQAASIATAVKSVLREGDEKGLHIHAWQSLFTAAGVKFKTEPAFKGPLDLKLCETDCGHDVNITAYSEADLRKVIRFSINTLEKNGLGRAKSFRAGAWQSDRKVMRALAAEGIELDASATDAEFLKERWGKTLLYPVTKKIWPDTTLTSQPYSIDLGGGQKILELPNNGCLADYVTGESILHTFEMNAAALKVDPAKDVFVSIGFHQETAVKFLPALRKGIDLILAKAQAEKIPIAFVVPPLSGLKN